MSQTYYLPNTVQLYQQQPLQPQQPQQPLRYNYYPPPPGNSYNYGYNNSESQQPTPTPQQEQQSQLSQKDQDDVAQGAMLLNGLKEAQKPAVNNNAKTFQRVFIHRVNTELEKDVNRAESDARHGMEDQIPRSIALIKEEEGEEIETDMEKELGTPNTKHSNADIIFANGNNREKRRVEMFENYSELYKFKERNRVLLYKRQKRELEAKLDLLSQPQNPNTEISEAKDLELFEREQDLVEARDFELTRLKNWRRYRRNENLKTYYRQSNEVYKTTNDVLIDKLERLKQFFIKQKNLLTNLDREYTDISSSRAEKFYAGFPQKLLTDHPSTSEGHPYSVPLAQQEQENSAESDHDHLSLPQGDHSHQNSNNQQESQPESSETDTGFTSTNSVPVRRGPGRPSRKPKPVKKARSSAKSKLNNTIISSILEGFAPILSHEEFQLVTNDDTRAKLTSAVIATPTNSDTDGSKKEGGRTTTSSRAVREARDREGYKDNNSAMNKIMKHYISPDELDLESIEEDLKFLRSNVKN